MTLVEPKLYRKYATKYKNGQEILYTKLKNPLYSFLRSALFLQEVSNGIEKYWF